MDFESLVRIDLKEKYAQMLDGKASPPAGSVSLRSVDTLEKNYRTLCGRLQSEAEEINAAIVSVKAEYNYRNALAAYRAGDFNGAKTVFDQLGNYRDAKNLSEDCSYNLALELFRDGQYQMAKGAFLQLKNYKDSKEMASECQRLIDEAAQAKKTEDRYSAAIGLYQKKEYKKAIDAFIALGSYKDSQSYAEKCRELYDAQLAREAAEKRELHYKYAVDAMNAAAGDNISTYERIKNYEDALSWLDDLPEDFKAVRQLKKKCQEELPRLKEILRLETEEQERKDKRKDKIDSFKYNIKKFAKKLKESYLYIFLFAPAVLFVISLITLIINYKQISFKNATSAWGIFLFFFFIASIIGIVRFIKLKTDNADETDTSTRVIAIICAVAFLIFGIIYIVMTASIGRSVDPDDIKISVKSKGTGSYGSSARLNFVIVNKGGDTIANIVGEMEFYNGNEHIGSSTVTFNGPFEPDRKANQYVDFNNSDLLYADFAELGITYRITGIKGTDALQYMEVDGELIILKRPGEDPEPEEQVDMEDIWGKVVQAPLRLSYATLPSR